MENFFQLIAAFFGSLGFAMVFGMEKKELLLSSLGGLLSWGCYLFLYEFLHQELMLATILTAAVCQLYAEGMARLRKTPTTLFSIIAAVPLIPGGSLYRTMAAVVAEDSAAFQSFGLSTLKVSFGIAIGTSFVSALFYMQKQFRKKENR